MLLFSVLADLRLIESLMLIKQSVALIMRKNTLIEGVCVIIV